jgi:hypothetical protein
MVDINSASVTSFRLSLVTAASPVVGVVVAVEVGSPLLSFGAIDVPVAAGSGALVLSGAAVASAVVAWAVAAGRVAAGTAAVG